MPAIVTSWSGWKASVDAQLRKPTAATPLHAVTMVGMLASRAIPIRALPWNGRPNRRTGASSRGLQAGRSRAGAAPQTIATLARRATSAPRTKLQSPAPARAAATASV